MTPMTILGQDWSGNSLWVALRDDDGFEDEYEVHEFDLDVMQRDVNRGYSARLFGRRLHTLQVRALADAILAPQRFWPPVICREGDCGAEASVRIEGEPYCHGHAAGFTAREEGQ
jgi:hypothetical protein